MLYQKVKEAKIKLTIRKNTYADTWKNYWLRETSI